MLCSLAGTITRTDETVDATWPRSIAGRPSGMNWYRLTNTRSSAEPTTISGVTNGTRAMPLATLLLRERQRVSPIASMTPRGVATSTVADPRIRLFFKDRSKLGSSPIDPSAQQYHCVENPCQTLRDRPLLNENCTAIRTG